MAKRSSKAAGGDLVMWVIYRLGSTPMRSIGSVWATDEASAIKRAIEELKVPKAQQFRLVARRA